MKSVFYFTLVNAWRSRHIQVFAIILLLAIAVSSVNGVLGIKVREQQFERARQEVRTAWLGQGPKNPHSAAHYGHYVFQPVFGIQALDQGINGYAGMVVRLEAHAQHEPTFSPAQMRTETARLGGLSISWIFQSLIPLFIILLCFSSVSGEREQQVLRMIAVQGKNMGSFLWGKSLSSFFLVSCVSLIGLIVHTLVTVLWGGQGFQSQDILHATAWTTAHLLYFLILINLSVCISAWSASSRTSLFIQVSAWALLLVVMPRLTASLGSEMFPMEQRTAFNKALREDREKGIDGHDPQDQRYKKFEDSLLRHYRVDSLSQLPVNADGLIMQADEEYANIVYDRHFTRIRETVQKQNEVTRQAALVNPYLAVRNLSMGIAQSDFHHHMDFLQSAEQYRRYLIEQLNTSMAYGGSKTGNWDWTADPGYWSTVADFTYQRRSLFWSLTQYRYEIITLLLWLAISAALMVWTSKRTRII